MNVARILYWSTFFFGTAGVYYAAPLARPYFATASTPNLTPQSERAAANTPGTGSDAHAQPYVVGASETTAESHTTSASTATPESRTIISQPAPAPVSAAAASTAADDDDDFTAPALNGVFVASTREIPTWGITIKTIPYYKVDGSNQGALPPGTLLLCKSQHSSSRGDMVECMVRRDNRDTGPFLIARKEALFLSGRPDALSQRQLAVLTHYYALVSSIEARKKELIESDAAVNPHVPAARRAYEAYMKNLDEAKRIAAARDAAQGLIRSQHEEKLGRLKFEATRLKAELDKAQEKLREWKKKNPDKVSNPDKDPTILALLQQQKSLASKIPGLAY